MNARVSLDGDRSSPPGGSASGGGIRPERTARAEPECEVYIDHPPTPGRAMNDFVSDPTRGPAHGAGRSPSRSAVVVLAALLAGPAGWVCAQGTDTPRAKARSAQQATPREFRARTLEWPRDRDRVVARVDGKELTLADLVAHMAERHSPDLPKILATPAGRFFFRTPRAADWVRQFADVTALEMEARSRRLDLSKADEHLSRALEAGFASYLEGILRERARTGRNTELSDRTKMIYLDEFQRFRGLQTEVQGWLDFLVPDDFTEKQLYDFFTRNARIFGGRLTMAHILIRHRHPVTLALYEPEGIRAAWARVEDIRARLAKDGSNFEDVARAWSEDRKTAPRGGVLDGVERFDPLLPAILCRTAWNLEDGKWTGPVESRFGLHFVKRIGVSQLQFLLYTNETKPLVRRTLRQKLQEDLIFEVRRKRRIRLEY